MRASAVHWGASIGIVFLLSAYLFRYYRERSLVAATVIQASTAALCINHNIQIMRHGYVANAHLVMGYEFAYLFLAMVMVRILACKKPWWLRAAAWLYLIVVAITSLEYMLMDQCYCNRDLANRIYWWRMGIGITIDWTLAIFLYSCRVDTSIGA